MDKDIKDFCDMDYLHLKESRFAGDIAITKDGYVYKNINTNVWALIEPTNAKDNH